MSDIQKVELVEKQSSKYENTYKLFKYITNFKKCTDVKDILKTYMQCASVVNKTLHNTNDSETIEKFLTEIGIK